MARIAFLGLGRMGSGMASRLLAAGNELVVWNRTPARAAALIAAGARAAASPAEAAAEVDAVFAMVSDDEASREIWTGPDGALAGEPRRGTLAIECSTLSHEWVGELSAAVAERGLRYVDAPVTGLPEAAASGALTLLVGGADGDVASARPLLEPLAAAVVHFGPVGSGTAYKLIVNLMGAVQIAGVAEGLALAERAGLDLAQVADVLATGQAASPQVVRNAVRMVAADHDRDVVFSGRLRRKDTAYALRLADALGLEAPLGDVALAGLDAVVDSGNGEANESVVIEVARARHTRLTPDTPADGGRAEAQA
jgi:3-hydroxyisobutyrate dehydrogenase